MPENTKPIASRRILAIDNGGREFEITLGIGPAYVISEEEWACPVIMDGMYPRHDVHGVDSWQSMQLAYQLVDQLLNHFVDAGGQLLWPGKREPYIHR